MTATSLKVVAIGATRYATYDFLLVFHCNYVSILYDYPDIISYFFQIK